MRRQAWDLTDAADPIDPVSRLELVDPVLCTDGLIHDRWSVLLTADALDSRTKQPLRIVGEVTQLKEAIQKVRARASTATDPADVPDAARRVRAPQNSLPCGASALLRLR